MQPVLNIEDIRAVERRLSDAGVSVSELMHRAGGAAAQEVMHLGDVSRVVVLAGFGNNGGDGWVAAEDLKASGIDVRVVTPCEPENLHGDLAPMVARAAIESGVKYLVGPSRDELDQLLGAADVVLDAMLGTGFHDAPVAPLSIWIDALQFLRSPRGLRRRPEWPVRADRPCSGGCGGGGRHDHDARPEAGPAV